MEQITDTATLSAGPSRRKLALRCAVALIAGVAALQIGLSAHLSGADVRHYLKFARALQGCDLWLEGSNLSPTGVIIDHHAVGPGLAWVPFMWARRLVERVWGRAAPPLTYAYGAHFLHAVLLAVLVERVMQRAGIVGYHKCASIFLAFSGTALFYYAFLAVSAELLAALTVFGLFAHLYCNSRSEGKLRFYAYAGMLAGAAVTVRGSNVALVAPVAILICCRAFRLGAWSQAVRRCLMFITAAFGTALPFLTTNWLFTGSALKTPVSYRLPSGHYVWFDWSDLHVQEVRLSAKFR